MLCNHEFFIRPNGPRRNRARFGADARPAFAICGGVKFHPEPTGVTANPFANYGRVLADAACKHQRVQAADGGCQSIKFASDAINEEVDRKLSTRSRALQQRAHVARGWAHPLRSNG
jgi:hypothetical protein